MTSDATDLIARHPWVLLTGGLEGDYQGLYNQPQDVHVWFLYAILRFGLVTALALLVFFLVWLVRMMKLVNSAVGRDRYLALGLLSGLGVSILVYGETAPLIDNAQNNLLLLFWFGVSSCLYSRHRALDGEAITEVV